MHKLAGQEKTPPTSAAPARTGSGKSVSSIPSFPDWVQHLQGTVGNRAVGRWLAGAAGNGQLGPGPPASTRAAPEWTVGPPGDAFERDADRVAESVMTAPAGATVSPSMHSEGPLGVRRKCARCEAEAGRGDTVAAAGQDRGKCASCAEEEGKIRREPRGGGSASPAVSPRVAARIDGMKGSGQPLSSPERGFFESRLGTDLGQVRIHDGSDAAEAARSLRAHAFTTGRHVVFAAGRYAPGTPEGRRLLAHELAHVLQQRGDASAPIRRQPADAPGVHSGGGAGVVGPSGIPAEKWSPQIQAEYAKRGDTLRANAIRACRVDGGAACTMLLTASEAQALYAIGNACKGDTEKAREALGAMGPVVGIASQASRANPVVVRGALAALRAVPAVAAEVAPVVTAAVAPAAAPAAATGGLTLAAVAPPVALLAIVVVTSYLLWKIGQFQAELRKAGFIILEEPLALCVGGCHASPAADTSRSVLDNPNFGDFGASGAFDPSWFEPEAPKDQVDALPSVQARVPVMPAGLSVEKQAKWEACKQLHEQYKKSDAETGKLSSQLKALLSTLNSNPKDAASKAKLCELIHLIRIQREITKSGRWQYMKDKCDEFDWFNQGTTQAGRRAAHAAGMKNLEMSLDRLEKLRKRWCSS